METKSSKSIQILLGIIAIALIAIVVFLVKKNNNSLPTKISDNIPADATSKSENINVLQNTEKSTEFIQYTNSVGSFNYKKSVKVFSLKDSPNIIKIGLSENDPNLETVEFLPDMSGMDVTPYLDNADYKNEVHGNNSFEVFESIEGDYYKHFVLINGNKSISILSKNKEIQYIDLNTVFFNK
jgi:hypothetical protein